MILALSCVLGDAPVWAYISIGTEVQLSVEASQLKVWIRVTNSGDEAAHQLQAVLQQGQTTTALPATERLEAGGAVNREARLLLSQLAPGTHPLFVTLLYQDANGYPFSAVLCPTFRIGDAPPADIFGTLQGGTLSETLRLEGRVKSMAQSPVALRLGVLTPREFSVDDQPTQLTLDPGEEKSLSVVLRNFSALSGSTYPVYLVAEYQLADFHHTLVLTTPVEVIQQTWVGRHRWPLLIAAGLLVLFGLAFFIIRRFSSTFGGGR